jgi:hypothetical protein
MKFPLTTQTKYKLQLFKSKHGRGPLTDIRRTHQVLEYLHPTEFPFKSLRVFDHKRLYLVNRADEIMK